jgi:hypothetical protein
MICLYIENCERYTIFNDKLRIVFKDIRINLCPNKELFSILQFIWKKSIFRRISLNLEPSSAE